MNKNYDFLLWLSRKINYPLVPPKILQISLTHRCNLSCKMCTISNLLPLEEELSTKQVLAIVDQAIDYGIGEILFTGGEPLLREDIFELCQYCSDKGITTVITTNGTLIDEDVAQRLSDVRVGHMHFSLDGLEQVNDFFRKEGVFKKVVESISILNNLEWRPSIGIALTVMNKNVGQLFELVKFADELGVNILNFQPVAKDNTNFNNSDHSEFWLNDSQILIFKEQLDKIKQYKAKQLVIHQEPPPDLLVSYYRGNTKAKDWVCFGGFKAMFVCFSKKTPLVYSCHDTCGNLNQVSLQKAWKSKAAASLRYHSGQCDKLCLQSCYSYQKAKSLLNVFKR